MFKLEIVGLSFLLIIAVGWSLYEFIGSAQQFMAPDNADRDAINAKYGEGTPEALRAIDKRFGPGDHWRDAATGLGGLAGLATLLWIWFG